MKQSEGDQMIYINMHFYGRDHLTQVDDHNCLDQALEVWHEYDGAIIIIQNEDESETMHFNQAEHNRFISGPVQEF